MHRNGWRWFGVAAVLAGIGTGTTFSAGAADAPAVAAPAAPPLLQYGGDLRVREEYLDHILIKADPPGETRGGENNYLRVRTRLWTQLNATEQLALRLRVANEFRHYWSPDHDGTGRNAWNYPDDWVVDNLYLDANKLLDGAFDLRLGRQDLMYGTGRLIMDGTPKDGSRTIYQDAVKLVWHATEKTTVDFLGIYNEPENQLAYPSQNRDLTGQLSGFNDITESGGGAYLKSKSSDVLPFEAYYLFKQESNWEQPARANPAGGFLPPKLAWQSLDATRGKLLNPELNVHTVGTRLMPKWSDEWDANVELAGQFGERGSSDVAAYGADVVLNYHPASYAEYKPTLAAGVYALSGDDPKTADDEGWNPLWSRWPQYSEMYIYNYDADGAARWSNLTMPHVDCVFSPTKWLKTTAYVGYMLADQDDGPGDGKLRGWLYVAKAEFSIAQKLLSDRDALKAHLWLELLDPGDYYKRDDTNIFARWEVMYLF